MSFDLDTDFLLIVGSALAAFLSFVVVALPLIGRFERKERYRSVIERRRKTLLEAVQEESDRRRSPLQAGSAAESMAALYRLQKLAGSASKTARTKVLQAGIRNPAAPLIYLLSRIVVPLVFVTLCMVFLANVQKDLPEAVPPLALMGSALFGFMLPGLLIKNMADKRQQEIALTFPDALDMMLICVQGGLSVEGAINKIAESVADHSETLAEELGLLSAELAMLNDRRGAFQAFSGRVGTSSARSFSTAMVQAEQYGTSVSKALRILSEELRDQRMAEAERKAASLPPKLTVPMIAFFLPALFIVILGPAFLSVPG